MIHQSTPRSRARISAFALAGLVLVLDSSGLETRYEPARGVRIESETRLSLETTAFDMERDGEPVEAPFDPVGQRSGETRRTVIVDRVLEAADGEPTRLRRAFESVEAKSVVAAPDGEREVVRECPLDGVTVELVVEDGEVHASVVDGAEPDDATLLEGQRLQLALDTLLPDGELEVGATWELDSDAIVAALGFDQEARLFPRPERPERPEGDGEGGQGRRGGRRGAPQGGLSTLLRDADWSGTARLASLDHEEDGVEGACARIELELSCSGELPEPEFGGGRGGRGRAVSSPLTAGAVSGTFEVELKGHLAFSKELALPVVLELEGRLETDQTMERTRGESSMSIHTEQSGEIHHTVRVELAGEESVPIEAGAKSDE